MGGLETPRLLLASRDVHMDGLGNATDLVGRFYMSHISGAVGSFRPRGGASRVHHGYERDADGVYCRRRLRLADEAARELGVGNFIARLHHPAIADPVHRSGVLSALCLSRHMFSYEYGKRLRAAEEAGWAVWLGHLRNIAADPFGVAEFVFDMARRHVFARRKFPSHSLLELCCQPAGYPSIPVVGLNIARLAVLVRTGSHRVARVCYKR